MRLMKRILFIAIAMPSVHLYSQENQAQKMTNEETVILFLNGFNDPTKIQESLNYLAEDYKFTNPMVELNSKEEFIILATDMGAILTEVNLIHSAENGDWVATFYEFKSDLPGLESNLASEWFRLEDGLIKESRLIYDASEWRKVYEEMEK